jgi:acetoin utilization deacetylase AcuC-like enzyme
LPTAYITHADCLKHEMGSYHPESPQRLLAIEDQLLSAGLLHYLQRHDAPLASREQLARVHTPDYLDTIERMAPTQGLAYLDPDTAMNPFSHTAALRAAGAAVLAADLVMAGTVANAFCAVRPPGHHATADRAMGFCIYNNVAVGVAHALAQHGLQRVAIVDFDVHHGNGTEAIFRDDARVLLCSSFQHPFYPHCGADSSSDHIINLPLPAGTDGTAYRQAFSARFLPALDAFQPQMVFVSAGFDAHRDEEMASLRLAEPDYTWITEQITAVADKHARGRIVSLLEGGYDLHALGRSVAAHLKVLSGL